MLSFPDPSTIYRPQHRSEEHAEMFKVTQEFEPVCSEEETETTSKGMKNNSLAFEFKFFFQFHLNCYKRI